MKALVHAILKERDSMYYYLDKLKYAYNTNIAVPNSMNEFDPYRNEERFKSLLKEFYMPTSQ